MDFTGNTIGCDVGYQLRDEIGIEMIRQSVKMLRLDTQAVFREITSIVLKVIEDSRQTSQLSAERMKQELSQIKEKKKHVLDAFFTKVISRNDMILINAEYDRRINELTEHIAKITLQENTPFDAITQKENICTAVKTILSGETVSENFYGNLLDHITAYKSRYIEVHLKWLPTKWTYLQTSFRDL